MCFSSFLSFQVLSFLLKNKCGIQLPNTFLDLRVDSVTSDNAMLAMVYSVRVILSDVFFIYCLKLEIFVYF